MLYRFTVCRASNVNNFNSDANFSSSRIAYEILANWCETSSFVRCHHKQFADTLHIFWKKKANIDNRFCDFAMLDVEIRCVPMNRVQFACVCVWFACCVYISISCITFHARLDTISYKIVDAIRHGNKRVREMKMERKKKCARREKKAVIEHIEKKKCVVRIGKFAHTFRGLFMTGFTFARSQHNDSLSSFSSLPSFSIHNSQNTRWTDVS